jgi:TP901 family phage tail tape measure protein
MPIKTVVEEIVTVFSGDSKNLDRTLKHIVNASTQAQRVVQGAVKNIAKTIENAQPKRIIIPGMKLGLPALSRQQSKAGHQISGMMGHYQSMLASGSHPMQAQARAPGRNVGYPLSAYQNAPSLSGAFNGLIKNANKARNVIGTLFTTFNRGLRRMWYDSRMIGQSFQYYFIAPLLGGLTAAIYMFAKFDDKVNSALALFGNKGAGVDKALKDTISGISKNSRSSPDELAEMLKVLSSANYTAGQSAKMLGTIEKFYVASGMTDATRATELLIGSQSALGMRVENNAENLANMTKVASLLARTNQLAVGSIEEFAAALTNRAAGALKMVGKDAEEGLAILAAFAMQDLKGPSAGTQLSIMIRELQRASLAAPKAWEQILGVNVIYDNMGEMKNLGEIIGALSDKFETMNDKQRKQVLTMLKFNDRSQNSISMLIGLSKQIKIFETALRESGATLQDMYDKRMESLMSVLANARNQVVLFAMSIGDLFVPEMKKLRDVLDRMEKAWSKLSDRTKKNIVYVGLAIAAVGGLIAMFATLGAVIAASTTAWTTIAAILTAIGSIPMAGAGTGLAVGASTVAATLGPIAWAVAAITAAVAGLIYLFYGSKGLIAAWNFVASTIMFCTGVLVSAVKIWWSVVSSFFKVVFNDFTQLPKLAQNVMHNLTAIFMGAARIMNVIFYYYLKKVFTTDFWGIVVQGLVGASKLFNGFARIVAGLMTNAFKGIFDSGKDVHKQVSEAMASMLIDMLDIKGGESLGKQIGKIVEDTKKNMVNLLDGTGLEQKLNDQLVDPLAEAEKQVDAVKNTLKSPFNMRFSATGIEAIIAGTGEAFDLVKSHLIDQAVTGGPDLLDKFMGTGLSATINSPEGLGDTNAILSDILTELKSGGVNDRMKENVRIEPMRIL